MVTAQDCKRQDGGTRKNRFHEDVVLQSHAKGDYVGSDSTAVSAKCHVMPNFVQY